MKDKGNIENKKDVENKENGIEEIIMRAIQDDEFRKGLVEDPDNVLKDYDITEMQRMLIKSLLAYIGN